MRAILTFALCLLLFLPVLAGSGEILKNEKPLPGRYIVVLEDGVTRGDFGSEGLLPTVGQVAAELARAHEGTIGFVYETALRGFSVALTEEQARRLSRDARVKFVEQDGVVTADTTQTNATWGIDRVDQRDLPLSTTYVYTKTGSGVNAYIIDTGIRSTHQDFSGRVKSGYTSINDGRGTADCNGHGTHVAGTVGGTTYGVAKQVNLYPVRVLNCYGSGSTSGVIAGVDWVTNNRKLPAVANMSLSGGGSTSMDNAVKNSIQRGVVYAVAAGNNYGASACNYSPARVPEALTVGSTTSSDARSSFSNTGTCLDIFAPGSSVMSDWSSSDTATRSNSGTSMASPHVAGAAVLWLQGHPNDTPAQVGAALINNATANKVTNPGSGSPNRLLYTGFIN